MTGALEGTWLDLTAREPEVLHDPIPKANQQVGVNQPGVGYGAALPAEFQLDHVG
jgi:hypothetical protein